MDLRNILAENNTPPSRHQASAESHPGSHTPGHSYPTRHTTALNIHTDGQAYHSVHGLLQMGDMADQSNVAGSAAFSPSQQPKRIRFELLLQPALSPQRRNAARLPMRVQIFPHDTTESIISTVKNFYGLYEGQCVSFEDKDGNTLIARHENFDDSMTVFVRTAPGEYDSEDGTPASAQSPKRPRLGPPIQMEMLPPGQSLGLGTSRPTSRNTPHRSVSPQSGRGGRGTSVSSASKARSKPLMKGRAASSHGSLADLGGEPMLLDDSDTASVSSSRRGKNEILASAEISVENIVEGGRRKRAKFDSSELPLFVPSQVPMTTSVSSVSPQRRIGSGSAASPFAYNNAHTFAYTHPLPSPQSHTHIDIPYSNGVTSATLYQGAAYGHRHGLRMATARNSISVPGVLPTPDPTIGGSVISDEDVALQLMRLGDASNYSAQGRTSTSTLNEDAYSGKAEIASSAGDSVEASDGEDELPYARPGIGDYSSGEDYEDHNDTSFKGESDDIIPENAQGANRNKVNGAISKQHNSTNAFSKAVGKMGKPRVPGISKAKAKSIAGGHGKLPVSPSSLTPQSRKGSSGSLNFQHQFGPDEEDLSSKPRCQRCRKSKKGCDRQRPCGRCKDAGISIDGCVSEDEGNGRKGRYGRHMGVPVKKSSVDGVDVSPMMDFARSMSAAPAVAAATPGFVLGQEAGKKRKR